MPHHILLTSDMNDDPDPAVCEIPLTTDHVCAELPRVDAPPPLNVVTVALAPRFLRFAGPDKWIAARRHFDALSLGLTEMYLSDEDWFLAAAVVYLDLLNGWLAVKSANFMDEQYMFTDAQGALRAFEVESDMLHEFARADLSVALMPCPRCAGEGRVKRA
jgi:hypothetical protein